MAKKLHVAKLWQIEYKRPGISGSTGQDALYRILRMFDVDNSAEDICTDEFVLRRSGLQELRLHIAERDGCSGNTQENSVRNWRIPEWTGRSL